VPLVDILSRFTYTACIAASAEKQGIVLDFIEKIDTVAGTGVLFRYAGNTTRTSEL
jgi:hypothetical protein